MIIVPTYNMILAPDAALFYPLDQLRRTAGSSGVTVGEICDRLLLDNGTLSPLLKKMQQAGYIERNRSAEDDRVVLITLTEAGWALQEQAKDIPAKIAGCVDLAPEKAAMLYQLLYELLGNQRNKEGFK